MFSLTYVGVIVAILAKVMEVAGVTIGTEQLTNFVETFGVIVGGFIALYGRYRAGGIKWFGGKTKSKVNIN